MNASRAYALVIVALIAGALVLTNSFAQPAAAPKATRIAVCDIPELFKNYQRARDLSAQLAQQRQALTAEGKKRQDKIAELETERDSYKEGSQQYVTTNNKVKWEQIQAQAWLQYQTVQLDNQALRLTKEMYTEIKNAIAGVARQRGFDMVVQREQESLDTQNTQELRALIFSRRLLFAEESLDITPEILTRLNQAYTAIMPTTAPAP